MRGNNEGVSSPVCGDIAEHKKTKRAPTRPPRERRTILDNIVETFCRTDKDGLITMCSAAIENLLGYTPDEVIGQAARSLYVKPTARDDFLRAVEGGGGCVHDFEVRLKRKDNREIWASASGYYTYDKDGSVSGLEGTARDITRYKEVERRLLQAKTEAERANIAKTDFLLNMSHELRTPLNAIIGFSQIMALPTQGPLTGQQREYLDIILASGDHLLALINGVLDVARIEAGATQITLAPTDCLTVIEECVALVQPLAQDMAVEFSVENPLMESPLVLVDSIKFKQALLNLMSNAVKYNIRGGSVQVGLEIKNATALHIDVTDSGPGLSTEECAALFEPFQRLGAENSNIQGTGLGLVLAKRMMEAQGGDILVTSVPGYGSTFTVVVKRADG